MKLSYNIRGNLIVDRFFDPRTLRNLHEGGLESFNVGVVDNLSSFPKILSRGKLGNRCEAKQF